ncbi:MAG: hypothetical protein GEU71_03710 [Actinobacteria bacterium]|nr:hypothetical protein [Actinomycetota bacterium]
MIVETLGWYEVPFVVFSVLALCYATWLVLRRVGDYQAAIRGRVTNGRLTVARYRMAIQTIWAVLAVNLLAGSIYLAVRPGNPPDDPRSWFVVVILTLIPLSLFVAMWLEQRLQRLLIMQARLEMRK